ncbi:hypothetical protein AHF37_09543 [Paragonimus kellicotti]|nr:hypothetical protein AHF37_09543 [Paragonimus kellicotti]
MRQRKTRQHEAILSFSRVKKIFRSAALTQNIRLALTRLRSRLYPEEPSVSSEAKTINPPSVESIRFVSRKKKVKFQSCTAKAGKPRRRKRPILMIARSILLGESPHTFHDTLSDKSSSTEHHSRKPDHVLAVTPLNNTVLQIGWPRQPHSHALLSSYFHGEKFTNLRDSFRPYINSTPLKLSLGPLELHDDRHNLLVVKRESLIHLLYILYGFYTIVKN